MKKRIEQQQSSRQQLWLCPLDADKRRPPRRGPEENAGLQLKEKVGKVEILGSAIWTKRHI